MTRKTTAGDPAESAPVAQDSAPAPTPVAERPRQGGAYVRVNGKLQRREA